MKQLTLNLQTGTEATGGMTISSSPVASPDHANRTATQAKDLVKKTIAISGRRCYERYEKFNHVGSWAKMFTDLLIGMGDWFSTRCKLTWKLKGTKYKRTYCQLRVSTLHTDEIGFGLLPTPMAQSRQATEEQTKARQEKYGGKRRAMYLENFAVMGMLPTPAASNYKGASSQEALEKRGRLKEKADNLCNQFAVSGKSSQLNPHFVMEMMGFPPDWTLLPFLNGETSQSKPEATP